MYRSHPIILTPLEILFGRIQLSCRSELTVVVMISRISKTLPSAAAEFMNLPFSIIEREMAKKMCQAHDIKCIFKAYSCKMRY